MNYRELFAEQCRRYPGLTAQDLVKALYQSVFGCGHFVGEAGRSYLEAELMRLGDPPETPLIEPIGDAYCRVHLSAMEGHGLAADTLFNLFALTSRESTGTMDDMLAGLNELEKMLAEGALPIDAAGGKKFIADYRASGCPATHHSDAFRKAYSPAYRVVSAGMCRYMEVFYAIDRAMSGTGPIIAAIEGGSASGKTSLGTLLEKVYDINLFHMDDFFLQPHQRTPERFSEPGGNFDRERFIEEVLLPLKNGGQFSYRKFNCSTMSLGEAVKVAPKKLNIIEGAYSMHPELRDAYTITVFLDSDPEVQRGRILRRNGERMLQRFVNEWIPLEQIYFEKTGVREACAIIIPPPEK